MAEAVEANAHVEGPAALTELRQRPGHGEEDSDTGGWGRGREDE